MLQTACQTWANSKLNLRTAAIAAKAVNRHDTRMFEPTGDLGFEHESDAAGEIVGVIPDAGVRVRTDAVGREAGIKLMPLRRTTRSQLISSLTLRDRFGKKSGTGIVAPRVRSLPASGLLFRIASPTRVSA